MKIVATKPMDRIRGDALKTVDEIMKERRTNIVGPNADVYAFKYEEAVRNSEFHPILSAEAEAKGIGVDELATQVWAKRQEMVTRLAQLEAERQKLQQQIRAAADPAAVSKILKGVQSS